MSGPSFCFTQDQLEAAGARFVDALPEADRETGRTIFHAARAFLLSPPAEKLRVQHSPPAATSGLRSDEPVQGELGRVTLAGREASVSPERQAPPVRLPPNLSESEPFEP